MVRKILCPVDFSTCSQCALDYAAHFADELPGATLDVLHAFEFTQPLRPDLTAWIGPGDTRAMQEVARTSAEDALQRFLAALPESVRRHVRNTEVRFGNASDEIVAYAKDNQYDLIVMGTHGHSGFRHLLMGSVTDRVVRHAEVPVLTVREGK